MWVDVGFLLSIVLLLVTVIALVALFGAMAWFCVCAFQKHVGWGLGVLFLPGLCSLILMVTDWNRVREPVKLFALSLGVLLVGTTGLELLD